MLALTSVGSTVHAVASTSRRYCGQASWTFNIARATPKVGLGRLHVAFAPGWLGLHRISLGFTQIRFWGRRNRGARRTFQILDEHAGELLGENRPVDHHHQISV